MPLPCDPKATICYGDADHEHFKQPEDADKLVNMANRVSASVDRSIGWIHLPVPRDRDDDAYYASLSDLRLHEGDEPISRTRAPDRWCEGDRTTDLDRETGRPDVRCGDGVRHGPPRS